MNVPESKACAQLRLFAQIQARKLEAEEALINKDEDKIASLRRAMEQTREKREKLGCLP